MKHFTIINVIILLCMSIILSICLLALAPRSTRTILAIRARRAMRSTGNIGILEIRSSHPHLRYASRGRVVISCQMKSPKKASISSASSPPREILATGHWNMAKEKPPQNGFHWSKKVTLNIKPPKN